MVNIKSYKDGNRMVLVIENCVGETAVKVNRFVSDLLGFEEEPIKVPKLIPIEVEKEAEPKPEENEAITEITTEKPFEEPVQQEASELLVSGPYKGLNPNEAVKKHGVKAALWLLKTPNASTKALCKRCIEDDLSSREPMMAESYDFADFVETYQGFIDESVKQLLNMAGYGSVEEFAEFSTEKELRDGYEALIAATYAELLDK